MAISSPFKICRLQASYIISRKPEHLETFQMFSPKNTAAEITLHIQQSYNKFPRPRNIKSFWGQQKNSTEFSFTYCIRDWKGQLAMKRHELEISFPFSTASFKLLYILGPQTFQSAIHEGLSGKRHAECRKLALDCTKKESNFSQEADKACYSSALTSQLEVTNQRFSGTHEILLSALRFIKYSNQKTVTGLEVSKHYFSFKQDVELA